MSEDNALLRELMAVFDDLPAPLRDAINYAPQPLDPKDLATLCRRHGAANVLAMIEMKLKRAAERKPYRLSRAGRPVRLADEPLQRTANAGNQYNQCGWVLFQPIERA